MIIAISGKPGSGKSTVAKKLAKKLKLRHFSMGDLQREYAKEKGITIDELGKLESKNDSLDKEVDECQKKLAKKYDNFVIDSRLSFFFIPKSIKIFLDCSQEESAKRIFKDTTNNIRDSSERKAKSLEETKKILVEREKVNKERWFKYYGIDFLDLSKYDLVVDTTKRKENEVLKKVLIYVNKFKKIKN